MPYRPPQFKVLPDPKQRVPQGFEGRFAQKQKASLSSLQAARLANRKPIKRMKMSFAYLLSILIHLFLPVSLVMLNLLLFILGFDLVNPFAKPEPVVKDIEFVITPARHVEEMPLDPETHFRAEENSRAGGEHDPDKAINMNEESISSSQAIAKSSSIPNPPVEKPHPLPDQVSTRSITKPEIIEPSRKYEPKPLVEKVKPVIKTTVPLAKEIPKIPLPAIAVKDDTKVSDSPAKAPYSFISESSSSSSSIASSGSIYNPSPGNKNALPGVDAIKEPDFGPYMKELQKRIKQNWKPPRGNESKQIVVVFRVDREGHLGPLKITKSSGVPIADQAAILAVQQVFPFRPLPQEYAKEDIDIEFTFDYNVFGDKNRFRKTFGEG